jgi:hypothetical protein
MTGPGSLFDLPSAGPSTVAVTVAPAGRPGLDEKVKRALISKGHLDEATGATRKARQRRCEVCKRTVWRGFNADMGYMSTDLDREPLTAAGELAAVMAEVFTYTMRYKPGYGHVFDGPRDQWQVKGSPAEGGNYDILARHSHEPISYGKAKTRLADNVKAAELPDKPPF